MEDKNLKISRIILGLWRITDKKLTKNSLEKIIQFAIEQDIDTFDQADIYGNYLSQELFGEVLRNNNSLRRQIKIISKGNIQLVSEKKPLNRVKHYDSSKKHIIESVEKTLMQLNTDYIDIFLLHRWDPLIDPEIITDTFKTLKESGKVLNFGVSNFLPNQFDLLNANLPFKLLYNQIEVSVLNIESFNNGTLTHCLKNKILPIAWSPFAGGKLFNPKIDREIRISKKLKTVAKKYEKTDSQIALAWLLKHPANIYPIIGTLNLERIEDAMQSIKIDLDLQDWYEIFEASNGKPVP